MAPPIVGNGRAFPGHLPWPPAAFSAAVPTTPVPGSLSSPIKWNPLHAFSRFGPFPSSPVAASPLPAFSFSLSGAGQHPAASPSSPEHHPVAPSPPSASQPPPLPRSALRFAGKSPETCPRRQNSGVAATVLPPATSAASPVRRPTSPPPLPAPERHPLPRPSHGVARISPERRRPRRLSLGLVGTHSGRPFRRASAPADVAISTSGLAAARLPSASPPLRPNPAGVRRRRHRSSSPARRLAAPPPSSASQRRVPRRPRLRAAIAGCPRCLLAGPGRHRCRPLVVPGRRGIRPSVKPFSSVVRVCQVCRCSPVVVFVLASASSSPAPAVSRLRPRIAAEVVPSPFVSVVPDRLRRARSSLSFPRLVAWWLVALLVCFA
ncbi:vegetative cell wall protein gp1-like [Oryza sativa Japonica Group]|uniref:vegetative cell wall protein gp1-like n=1 Tax=Oryza sativa subsp. japonica TaxID=39947 RepID=UPI00339C5154